MSASKAVPVQYGCHVDAEGEEIIDTACVIHLGRPNDCVHSSGEDGVSSPEQCPYWKPVQEGDRWKLSDQEEGKA